LRFSNFLKSQTARLSAIFAALFLALTGVLMGTVLWIVNGTLSATLLRENDADIETVGNGFRDEGIEEAAEVIKQRLGNPKYGRGIRPDSYMILETAQGVLAGNLPPQPRRLGVFYTPLRVASSPGERRGESSHMLLGRGTEIAPGAYLFVGRDIRPMVATRARIIDAFILVTIGAVAIAIGVGLYLGRRFAQRVDAVARACESIVAGRMNERIELQGGHEWDRLASVINDMLNRISALLENLRQISSDVAHDLRTPLTRLRNRLEQAREESATTADYVGAISAAIGDTDQILSMFASLLRISQVEAGSRLTKFAAVDLTHLCEKVFRIYLPVAEDYGHRLTANLASDVVIRGDPELLTQMFVNLIENAIHHTPKGTTIGIALAGEAGDTLATVSDDGPGIAKDQAEKVLQRFYRLSSSRAAPGHGLGLALVAAVVQLHGGKVTLEDAAPGLKVAIRFPA